MAEELGQVVEVDGKEEYAFPGPSSLLELGSFPSLSERKVGYLRALARAAQEGRLEASYLRSLPAEEALAELRKLPGIGGFSAELVLLRGAGVPDRLPIHEPQLTRAVAMAYGLMQPPSAEEFAEISERWRPYRTWVALHLRTMLENETGEIAGGPKSSLAAPDSA
jgi:DNA-3-methyladenine glycosylase II